jgi:hypothetical protein
MLGDAGKSGGGVVAGLVENGLAIGKEDCVRVPHGREQGWHVVDTQ